MKRLYTLLLITMFSTSINAQMFAEWSQQKATQKKYLLQQIAGLQVYIGYVQKGYSIAQQGLDVIGDIEYGELNLHSNYFNSLETVNPKIKQYSKVADIISLQLKIVNVYRNTLRQVKQSKTFNADELIYTGEVFSRLIDDCTSIIDDLTIIITSNQLEMKDDERLKRIDALCTDIQDKYSFVQSFANEAKDLAVSRLREQKEIKTSRALNGIK
ncbi:MAG TPA: hypothetical protein VF622_00645 [Segetibacter sp.]